MYRKRILIMTITDGIRLEILNKLRNKDKLEEKEIKFMVYCCEEVYREFKWMTCWHIEFSSVIKMATNEYYRIDWKKTLDEEKARNYFHYPRKVQKVMKIVEVFELCINN